MTSVVKPSRSLSDGTVEHQEHVSNVLRLRRLAVIALVAWPAFGLVDWFIVAYVHPGRLWVYLSLRAAGLLALVSVSIRMFAQPLPSPRLVRFLEVAAFTVLSALVTASAMEFEGIASPLALGVITILVARSAVLADHWKRALLPIGLASLAYPGVLLALTAVVPEMQRQLSDPRQVGLFVLNCTFVLGAAALTVVGGNAIWELRRQVYQARSLGRYKLQKRIDAGGMGEVWLAHHRTLKRDVAVKILRPEKHLEEESVARFEREVRATAGLRHPHTVRVYDYGTTEDGLCYYAMELLEGEDLGDILASEGALAPRRAVDLVLQAARAIAEAHDREIVHRDIKPANLFVTRVDGDREYVKVLDFGLAKCQLGDPGPAITQDDIVMGTPTYMSPEILQGHGADKPSDVYALGGVLYHLLAGAPPFDFKETHRVLRAHLERPVQPLSKRVDGEVDEAIEALLRKCLVKDPAQRYRDAGELATALEVCLEKLGEDADDPLALLLADGDNTGEVEKTTKVRQRAVRDDDQTRKVAREPGERVEAEIDSKTS